MVLILIFIMLLILFIILIFILILLFSTVARPNGRVAAGVSDARLRGGPGARRGGQVGLATWCAWRGCRGRRRPAAVAGLGSGPWEGRRCPRRTARNDGRDCASD